MVKKHIYLVQFCKDSNDVFFFFFFGVRSQSPKIAIELMIS